ncbi:MAG TPA: histidine kinase [Anaeromyxobacteraceae bacterium]
MKRRRWWPALLQTWHDRPARIRMGRQGLRFRVYLLVSVGVLAPAALVAGASWTRLRELDEELLAARRHAAVAVAEHIDEELTADLEVLQRLASAPQLGLDRERLESARTLLRAAYMHSQLKAGMFLLDAEGKVLAEEPRASRSAAPPAELPELRQTLVDGKPRLTDLVGVAGEGHAYALVSVMDWRGRPVGVVGGIVDVAAPLRARVLRHLLRGGRGHADLVDGHGMVLASTDRQRLHRPVECRRRLSEQVAKHEPQVARCGDCHRDLTSAIEPAVAAFAPLGTAGWGVQAVQPEEAVLATSGAFPTTFPIFAAVLVLVAGGFAWGAARSVTRPIAVLTAATERIAAGGMDEPIPALGGDELGRLGRSVERMRSSLRDLIAYVARANEVLEHRVQERTAELAQLNEQLRERDGQRQRLLRTVITAQEDERKRIARELHDETTQSLAVLTMGIETAAAAIKSGGPTPRLDEVKALAVRTLEEVHRLILDLRPSVLDDLGLFSALRWYAERYLATRGIAVRCEVRELDRRLAPEVEIALFRIGQEAMNNIARHAKAESVLIQLGLDGKDLHIEIEDDGQGFDPAVSPQDRPHYGLLGMRERAELLGGTAVIESSPGKGTRLEIRVPLPEEPPPSTGAAAGLQSVAS